MIRFFSKFDLWRTPEISKDKFGLDADESYLSQRFNVAMKANWALKCRIKGRLLGTLTISFESDELIFLADGFNMIIVTRWMLDMPHILPIFDLWENNSWHHKLHFVSLVLLFPFINSWLYDFIDQKRFPEDHW